MGTLWSWIPLLIWLVITDMMGTLPVPLESKPSSEDIQHAQEYLRQFYNISPRSRRHSDVMEDKIKKMQSFFGLPESGLLDHQTLAVMKKDRCGVPDVENFSLYPKRPRWKNHTITYWIATYTTELSREEVETSLHLAFKLWSDVTPLRFIRVHHNKADIVISFTTKAHGDFAPFDGPRGVLAHAFQPGEGIGGDVHFDDDEFWTTGYSSSGYNLFTVAAHEIGHSLGLSHSRDPSALMYPKYKYHDAATYTLPQDDLLGIQALYGKKTRLVNTINLDEQLTPEKCQPSLSFDAVVVVGQEILFFKNSYLWLRRKRSYGNWVQGGPVSTFLPSITSPVDAAYDLQAHGVFYVFTGSKYWIVQQLGVSSYYGSIYEYGFPAQVKSIDAAVHVSQSGKTYFFTGDVYYRYDELRSVMDPGFPRVINKDWAGITGRIDAALELEGTVYLFSGSKSFVFSHTHGGVLYIGRANTWLGC